MNYFEELTALLRSMGLNLYEAKAYAALLLYGDQTAAELSTRADLPRPRVYDIVGSLVKKGFVIVHPGRPVKYRAVPPKEAVENYIRSRRLEFEKEVEKIKRIGMEIEKRDIPQRKDERHNVWFLHNEVALRGRLEEMIRSGNNEIIAALPSDFLLDYYNTLAPLLEEALNRGVRVRLLIPKGYTAGLALPKEAEVVEVEHEMPPIVVVDSARAFVGIPREPKGIIVEHTGFSRSFRRLMDAVVG